MEVLALGIILSDINISIRLNYHPLMMIMQYLITYLITTSRCVQESFCKAENIDKCSTDHYYDDPDEESGAFERNDYDDYYDINKGCSCEPPRNVLTLLKSQDASERVVCCNNIAAGGPLECGEGFQ